MYARPRKQQQTGGRSGTYSRIYRVSRRHRAISDRYFSIRVRIFVTELISNTAVTAKMAPILMGVALQLGLDAESLVVPVAIATSMAFMLPVATPPNAMVHASGTVSQRDMMRAGLGLNLAAIVVISLLFYVRNL